jgi:four helix bundle protein
MATKFTELECWQLADKLRQEVVAICALEEVTRRRRFCDGFTDAAGSVCRNIAEGFTRFDSAQIVQFFTYALASLAEVEDYLRECLTREFIPRGRFDRSLELLERTRAKTTRFMRHHKAKVQRQRRHQQRRTPHAAPPRP